MRLFHLLVPLFAWLSGIMLILLLGSILGYLLVKGGAGFSLALVFGDVSPADAIFLRRQVFDGIFPAIAGTGLLIGIAMFMAIPMGLATGIYMAEYADGFTKKWLTVVFDVLAGLPSIIIGLSGLLVIILIHRLFPGRIGPCLLLSALSLGFLVLPYIIRSTQVALESVPRLIRQTAPVLGATRLQNIRYVLLPNSLKGIMGGIILAVGRAAEDTAVIMLTGAVVTAGIPRSLFGPYEALPFYIYYISAQYSDQQELAQGYSAALILLALCSFLFLLAFVVQQRIQSRFFSR